MDVIPNKLGEKINHPYHSAQFQIPANNPDQNNGHQTCYKSPYYSFNKTPLCSGQNIPLYQQQPILRIDSCSKKLLTEDK
jgi:hypothetical protein